MLPDGRVLAVWDLLHCLDGWVSETLADGQHVSNHATDPAYSLFAEETGDTGWRSPQYESAVIAWRHLSVQAAERKVALDGSNKAARQADEDRDERLAVMRAEYRKGETGTSLLKRLEAEGNGIPKNTFYKLFALIKK